MTWHHIGRFCPCVHKYKYTYNIFKCIINRMIPGVKNVMFGSLDSNWTFAGNLGCHFQSRVHHTKIISKNTFDVIYPQCTSQLNSSKINLKYLTFVGLERLLRQIHISQPPDCPSSWPSDTIRWPNSNCQSPSASVAKSPHRQPNLNKRVLIVFNGILLVLNY